MSDTCGNNNEFFNFILNLNSMKSSGILENNPDFEKSFEDSLKEYMAAKKQMEAFQAFITTHGQIEVNDDVAKVMEKYRKAKELLLEIYADLQINTNK